MLEKLFPILKSIKSNYLVECQMVYCFVDPCSFAKCDKHPEAICQYVNINFLLKIYYENFVLVPIIVVVVMPGFILLVNVLNAAKTFFSYLQNK